MADSSQKSRIRKRPLAITNSGEEEDKNGRKSQLIDIETKSSINSHTSSVLVHESDLKCRECLMRSLNHKNKCPMCALTLENTLEQVYPNFSLNKIVQQRRELNAQEKKLKLDLSSTSPLFTSSGDNILQLVNDPNLDLSTVTHLMSILEHRRNTLETNDNQCKVQLLNDFLEEMISRRQKQINCLNKELRVLTNDKDTTMQKIIEGRCVDQSQRLVPEYLSTVTSPVESNTDAQSLTLLRASTSTPSSDALGRMLVGARARLSAHFNELERAYLEYRNPMSMDGDDVSGTDLDEFSQILNKMTQYESFHRLATLNYNADFNTGGLSIVSSIEFDKDSEYFVVAGVTKKIKLYDYAVVLQDKVDIHYPIGEMQCNSKISSVCWSSYTKSMLASSDYDGTVQLWDAWTAQTVRKFQEHEKRCWTVQFSSVDPYLLASGSDDAKVKLWNVNSDRSVGCIDAKVNVCCVVFSPVNRHHLVFGSADHCVHFYDLRNTRRAVQVFKGHKKAVSYVRFCNATEVVSASTDSHLRLWNIETGKCVRTLKGHQNEKNFVGMATDGDHIVCGSENNNLYVYYKGLSQPLISYDFGVDFDQSPRDYRPRSSRDNDSNEFVSAVCWKKNSNVVVAANSQGLTQILELV